MMPGEKVWSSPAAARQQVYDRDLDGPGPVRDHLRKVRQFAGEQVRLCDRLGRYGLVNPEDEIAGANRCSRSADVDAILIRSQSGLVHLSPTTIASSSSQEDDTVRRCGRWPMTGSGISRPLIGDMQKNEYGPLDPRSMHARTSFSCESVRSLDGGSIKIN